MTTEDKNKLIFKVKKPIWLAIEEKPEFKEEFKVIGWTSIKPKKYGDKPIDKDTILIFDYIYKTPDIPEGMEGLNFIAIRPGKISEIKPEFTQKDIQSLAEEGALEPMWVWTDIDEISIAKGNVYLKYPTKASFHDNFFVPKDIYIIMGIDENRKSMGEFSVGEKVSLADIIDKYTSIIGKNISDIS